LLFFSSDFVLCEMDGTVLIDVEDEQNLSSPIAVLKKLEDYDKDIIQKLKEKIAITERLYQLRFDYSRPQLDIERDVKNLCNELLRLEDSIAKIHFHGLQKLENSLELEKNWLSESSHISRKIRS